jgi:cellulose synthase/poly-beta-1,6-N-acetylglucosamine synthase-like glycosyltransferase
VIGRSEDPAASAPEMKISVVVPSYRRPVELAACLEALAAQCLPPLEVLVVLRSDDAEGRACAATAAVKPEIVTVDRPGQVAALNRGCLASRGEIIAITDDDARPRPEWLAAIADRFATDARIGAVGGRDMVHYTGGIDGGEVDVVGRVQWWGRRIGNHHCRSGLQDVDFVKGVNMALRAVARRPFDERLWGAGSQICNDMEATWSIRRRGWRVVYDPAVVVDHYPAERLDDDKRNERSAVAEQNEQHNEVCALISHAPFWQKPVLFTYSLLVGSRRSPGLLLAILPSGRAPTRSRIVGLARARWSALRTMRAPDPASMWDPRAADDGRPTHVRWFL